MKSNTFQHFHPCSCLPQPSKLRNFARFSALRRLHLDMVILPRLFDADFKAPKGAFLALYHKAMKNSLYGVLGTMCIYHLWLNKRPASLRLIDFLNSRCSTLPENGTSSKYDSKCWNLEIKIFYFISNICQKITFPINCLSFLHYCVYEKIF